MGMDPDEVDRMVAGGSAARTEDWAEDKPLEIAPRRPRWWHWVIGIAALVAVMACVKWAYAHDEYDWIRRGNYSDPRTGIHCCGPSDCKRIDQADIEIRADGVYIRSLNELVPMAEVQEGQDAHWWRCHKYDGSRRCFFRPRSMS